MKNFSYLLLKKVVPKLFLLSIAKNILVVILAKNQHFELILLFSDDVAEWSKALVLGTSLHWRGFSKLTSTLNKFSQHIPYPSFFRIPPSSNDFFLPSAAKRSTLAKFDSDWSPQFFLVGRDEFIDFITPSWV